MKPNHSQSLNFIAVYYYFFLPLYFFLSVNGFTFRFVLKFDRGGKEIHEIALFGASDAHRTVRHRSWIYAYKNLKNKLSILSNMLGSRNCVYLTFSFCFSLITSSSSLFYARPVGLYGARVSVVCALSERGKGVKKRKTNINP